MNVPAEIPNLPTADERRRWGAHLDRCRSRPTWDFLLAYLRLIDTTPNADVVIGETMDGAEVTARSLLDTRPGLTRVDRLLIYPDIELHPELVIWRMFADGWRSEFVPMWPKAGAVAAWLQGANEYLNKRTGAGGQRNA